MYVWRKKLALIKNFDLKGTSANAGPTITNYTVELQTFVVIAEVSLIEVQWKSLALKEAPEWSGLLSRQVSMPFTPRFSSLNSSVGTSHMVRWHNFCTWFFCAIFQKIMLISHLWRRKKNFFFKACLHAKNRTSKNIKYSLGSLHWR